MQILESPEMMSKLTLFNGPPDYTHGDSPSTNSYQHGHFDMLEESDPGCRTMTCDVSAAFWDELVAKPNAEVNARCQTYLWKLSAKRQSFYEKVSTRILRSVRRHELRAECYEKWRQSLSFDDQRLIKRVYGDMADYDIWVFEFLEADEWKLGTSQRDGQRHTNEIRDMCRGESLHSEHPLSEDEEAPLRMPAGLTPSDRKDGSLNPVPDFTRYPGQSRSLSHPRPTSLQTKLLFYSTLFWIACPIVSADGKLQGFARIAQPMSGGISALSGFSITALHDDPRVVKEAYYSLFGVWAGSIVTFVALQSYLVVPEKRGTYILACIVVDTLLVAVFSLSTLPILEIMTAYAPLLSVATAFVAYQYFPKRASKRNPRQVISDDVEDGIQLQEYGASPSHGTIEGHASTGEEVAVYNDAEQVVHETFNHMEEPQESGGLQVSMPATQGLGGRQVSTPATQELGGRQVSTPALPEMES